MSATDALAATTIAVQEGRASAAGSRDASDDHADFHGLLESIRRLIVHNGGIPPERAVAEALNVKRHTVRRALEALRAKGELEPARAGRRASVEATPRRDALVNSTNPLEVMELRLVLEPALARLAALRASPDEIERIRRAARTAPGAEPNGADMVFHRAIAAGSRNSLASELYVLLRHVASDGRLRFTDSDAALLPERVRERDAEHRRIADAIAARNPEGAEEAMWQHLAAIQQKVVGRFVPGRLI